MAAAHGPPRKDKTRVPVPAARGARELARAIGERRVSRDRDGDRGHGGRQRESGARTEPQNEQDRGSGEQRRQRRQVLVDDQRESVERQSAAGEEPHERPARFEHDPSASTLASARVIARYPTLPA